MYKSGLATVSPSRVWAWPRPRGLLVALRRIAIHGLGAPRRTAIPTDSLSSQPAPASVGRTTPNPAMPPERTKTGPQDSTSQGQAIAAALIQFLCSFLFLGVWLFFISHKKKGLKGSMTT